jgi:endonuclease/exonuclease/phosphatase family metal-dependent hydrolase
MALPAFAERRRAARSSSLFRLILTVCLAFCLIIAWSSTSHPRTPHQQPRTPEQQPPHLDINTRNQIALSDPDTADMGQRKLPEQQQQASSPNLHISGQGAKLPLRIISYNIRYATTNPVKGEWPWSVRLPKLCTQLRFITAGHESPFLCLQEALYHQVNEIQTCLGAQWSHIGRGRDEDPTEGEFSPIFYRSDTWAVERYETRWLSETPYVPSIGWDAALNRIVTMGEFSHRVTGTRVVVMSTHFDHLGVKARENSAELLIRFADEWSRAGKFPPSVALIGGDFNSTPDDGAYKTMVAPGSGMSDISDLIPVDDHYGYRLTYTSFGEPMEGPSRIDFLFIREPRTAVVTTFGVLPNVFDDHIRTSDHRPVVSDLEIIP